METENVTNAAANTQAAALMPEIISFERCRIRRKVTAPRPAGFPAGVTN
jgi:hypothetical protein